MVWECKKKGLLSVDLSCRPRVFKMAFYTSEVDRAKGKTLEEISAIVRLELGLLQFVLRMDSFARFRW